MNTLFKDKINYLFTLIIIRLKKEFKRRKERFIRIIIY